MLRIQEPPLSYLTSRSKFDEIDATLAEKSLQTSPFEIVLRAKLLAHYSRQYWDSEVDVKNDIASFRKKHIFWFINNVPDWKFCGERYLHVYKSDNFYEETNKLWLAKIGESAELMRRINAYLPLLENEDSSARKFFADYLSSSSENIWIKAVSEACNSKITWFEDEIAIDSKKILPNFERIEKFTKDSQSKDLVSIAHAASLETIISDLPSAVNSFLLKPDLDSFLKLIGYTWSRFSLFSVLQLDPEISKFRFHLACWAFRHIPSTNIITNPLLIDPFFFSEIELLQPGRLESPASHLIKILVNQLQRQGNDVPLANNAAYLAFYLEESLLH